jgi:indole-3-glycerol phosphate synthase
MPEHPSEIPDVLARIVTRQRELLPRALEERPRSALRDAPLYAAPRRRLGEALDVRRPAIIAECKRRSPSRGVLRDPYDPVAIATSYAAAGAAALSVLTNEEFFGGSLRDLSAVRCAVGLPLLRKDFVLDSYHVEEARSAGADAILLIAAILSEGQLSELSAQAHELDLDVLVEVHDEAELRRALACGVRIVGINNRDLRTFQTDLATTERLVGRIPGDRLVVAESGLRDAADLARLERAGVHAFLVGEAFMTSADPGAALREMLGEQAR